MAKLIPLEEAASYLGVTPDQLVEMRSRNDIAGYRDGNSWKFKQSELDRVKQSLGGEIEIPQLEDQEEMDELVDVSHVDLSDEGSENDSILVSEESLGESDRSTSSTVIGKEDHVLTEEESDLQLVGDDDLDMEEAGPGVTMADPQAAASDSELRLAEHDEPVEAEQDVVGASHRTEEGESELELQFDDAELGDVAEEEEDDAMVLDDVGSDVTLSSGDSGINLASPSDSGISLEELGDDLDLDEPLVEVGDDQEVGVAEVRGDDDFLLTPDEEAVGEDDESGSQVIALEEEEFAETSDATLDAGPDFLEEEPLGVGMAAAPTAGAVRGSAEDVEFTGPNVLVLGVLALLMIFSALVVADVIVNMWSWSGGSFSSVLVDALVSPFSG